MDLPTSVIIGGVTVVATTGAAWGAVKQALNGTRARVTNIEQAQIEQTKHNEKIAERTASIETKVDILVEHLR